ncbi:MAG TPA: PAS domain S-box protein, partial [Anaerolineae bacterium]|nr:PAS domain S-box protein [Anaerolineae bacterium]
MNLHQSSLFPCCRWLMVLLLAIASLAACITTPPASVNPPLSTLRVVMDNNYPPYVFQDDQGRVQGILIDQWRLWEGQTGVKVNITSLPWGEALQRMKAGEFDVIDTIFYTDERAQTFDFTAPYARIDVPIFFHNNISGIATARDLKGFRVAVKSGDADVDYLIKQGVTNLTYYNRYEEIVEAAARKDETIFVIDQPPALYFLYKYGIQDQFKHSEPLYSGEFHRAVLKGHTAILNLVESGFADISPTEYQAIDRRWMGTGEASNLQQVTPYVVAGLIIVLVIILVLVAFSRTLQIRVRQRTLDLEKTAEALRASEERLRTVTENAPDTILQVDRGGIITYISQPVPGLTREQVVGTSIFQWVPEEQYPILTRTLEAVFETGERGEYESLGPGPYGEPHTYHVRAAPVTLNGQIDSAIYIASDITERKRAEEALRQSEDKFSKAFHTSPDSININRLSDGLYLEINEGFTTFTGYTEAEVQGKTTLDLNMWVNPADRLQLVQALQEHGQVANLEGQFRMKDGHIITGLLSARVIEIGGEKYLLNITRDITDRKRAEEALRESEEKFRAMIEQASEGFALIDENGLILEWNRAKERIWGLKREEVLGRPFYDVQFQVVTPERRTPERYEQLKAITLDAVRTGQSPLFNRVIEGELQRPDGQRVTIQQSIFVIKSRAGYRIGSMSLDITERKQTEAALKESERKMRAIVDAAPFGAHLYELETDDRLVFKGANHSADQILHTNHQQYVGKTIEEAFPPLIETEIPAAYRRVAITGEGYQLDQIAYDDSGISGAYELHAFQTGPNQMAVFFRDITERKQMEEALRVSLEKYRVLFESFPLGISITDSAGKILESNLEAEELLGVPKAEHERWTYDAPEWNLVRSDGTPMPVEEYAAARALRENRLIQNVEMGIVKEHGATTWLSVTAAPIPLKGYGVAIAYGDITRHKEIEDEIRRLNEDLEQRVVERTQELAAANVRLTELDQLKSKFVSDVSHELRTPIANLKLYIDLLERGKPDKQAHYVSVLQQQVRRVAALVDDILDLSRLERRKEQGMIYRAVALNDVVDQVVLAHQPRADAEGLLLTFEPAVHLPPVRADANQLAQVATNLIANALSYTAAGYVRVSTFAENSEVCLCVTDSGSGIAPDDLPHVFERFYRGRHVLKNDVPGTGLGLAIVKEIVELHNGRVEVDSRSDHGTTFRVWLP